VQHPRGDAYQHRFDALAAQGVDVHGEASFVEALDPAPRTVLDAGCGTGRVAIELHRRGLDVVGVDISPEMLATARRAAPALDWHVADLATLDLGRSFDAVVLAGNVVHFVAPGSQAAVVERCADHVAPGGALVAGFELGPGRYGVEGLDRHGGGRGLVLEARFAGWSREPWRPGGRYAVSVLRRS
jgi:SAM-dependent methyltransferase